MVPRAGSSNGFGISTMMSGLMFQPLLNVSGAGASASFPAGAPASAHALSVAISRSTRRRSLAKWPMLGSANHGGICLLVTAALMARAHGRACS
jgi:hypothetical protein